jgi:ketopantoate reductase
VLTDDQGNYIEYENLIGEPLREAQRIGLDTPILKTIYELCRMIQWKTKEGKGLVKLPAKRGL